MYGCERRKPMEKIPDDDPLLRDERFTAECLYLSQLFFKISDRKERLRIIALAESIIKLQTDGATDPDTTAR
jgi:hypothetical protein